jgi:hypothetical protein
VRRPAPIAALLAVLLLLAGAWIGKVLATPDDADLAGTAVRERALAAEVERWKAEAETLSQRLEHLAATGHLPPSDAPLLAAGPEPRQRPATPPAAAPPGAALSSEALAVEGGAFTALFAVRRGEPHLAGLESLASDPEALERYRALQVLAQANPQDALPHLERLLRDGEDSERTFALRTMVAHPNASFVPLAREALDDERLPAGDRQSLLQMLAALKGKRWATVQMTGPPDTPFAGDLVTAWAPKRQDMGEVWAELDFPEAVRPDHLRVHETYNPGAIVRVEGREPDGSWTLLWNGHAGAAEAPRWFEAPLRAMGATRTIRITLDTDAVPGWQEIDAVELLGDGLRQWASAARASSSYADE